MKIAKVGIQREEGYLYYIDSKGNISRQKAGVKSKPEVVKVLNLKRQFDYLLYVDHDGDVSSVPASASECSGCGISFTGILGMFKKQHKCQGDCEKFFCTDCSVTKLNKDQLCRDCSVELSRANMEKLVKCGIEVAHDYVYFVEWRKGYFGQCCVIVRREKLPDNSVDYNSKSEKIKKINLEPKSGWTYYIDEDGDVRGGLEEQEEDLLKIMLEAYRKIGISPKASDSPQLVEQKVKCGPLEFTSWSEPLTSNQKTFLWGTAIVATTGIVVGVAHVFRDKNININYKDFSVKIGGKQDEQSEK
jgi:hypothetical protein